jgi:rRNA maturation RNase YbeY
MPMREVRLFNRCVGSRVEARRFCRLARLLLEEELGLSSYVLHVRLVGTEEITTLNERFVKHAGVTDVITFDYSSGGGPGGLHSDLVICLDEVARQARRYHTGRGSELARCLVHGVLHLRGYRDGRPAERRRMKRAEGRLLRRLARRFPLSQLTPKTRLRS